MYQDEMQQDFNDAINFAIEDDEPVLFLQAWFDEETGIDDPLDYLIHTGQK